MCLTSSCRVMWDNHPIITQGTFAALAVMYQLVIVIIAVRYRLDVTLQFPRGNSNHMNEQSPAFIWLTMPVDVGEYVWLGLSIMHLLGVAVNFEETWLSSSTISVVVLLVVLGDVSK